ncbi:MAG TPA: HAD-IA family hydrolase [Ktedonobacteraceae bacterium]
MVKKRHIRCFLFDLGSTLWTRYEEGTRQAKEAGYEQVGDLLRRARGGEIFAARDAREVGREVHKAIGQQLRTEKHLRPEYEPDFARATRQALQLLGLAEADLELGARVFEMLRVRIPVSRVLFPDTLSTLETLRQRGYLLGVVTNRDYGGQPFREDLQSMGLLEYFEYHHMAISADLGVRKPNPDIFRYALERLSARPEETAMVGDNLLADVGGARALNMLGIWKPKPAVHRKYHTTQSAKVVPDVTIDALHDLLQIF